MEDATVEPKHTACTYTDNQLDEILEALWVDLEQNREPLVLFRKEWGGNYTDNAVAVLIERKELAAGDGAPEFTPEGREKARNIIRRHRLTEVLCRELLGIKPEVYEQMACRIEHELNKQYTDSVCTYLGHPKTCPHGRPIPPGECCSTLSTNVVPLAISGLHMELNKKYQVKYVHNTAESTLTRLMNYGLTPGSILVLKQKHPSFVIKLGETELALDKNVIANIYVRPVPTHSIK